MREIVYHSNDMELTLEMGGKVFLDTDIQEFDGNGLFQSANVTRRGDL